MHFLFSSMVLCSSFIVASEGIAWNLRDSLSGRSSWETPMKNPPLSPLAQEFLSEALEDLPGVIDSHVHVVCREKKNGCYVHPDLFSPLNHPVKSWKAKILLSAMGAEDDDEPDESAKARLFDLVRNFPGKAYTPFLFAFAATYDAETQAKRLDRTGLEVSNEYMLRLAKELGDAIPVGSLNPFQADLETAFEALKKDGVRFLKLLPNSMHIPPDDLRCERFFELLAKHQFTLITHVGDERSVEGGGIENRFGAPMAYEAWLRKFPTLRIVFAHVGSEGESEYKGKSSDNVSWVLHLMKEFPQQTWADISGFTAAPMRTKFLQAILKEESVHARLLYGSDYPLPATKPLLAASLWTMYLHGLLGGWADFSRTYKAALEIYNHNPLAAALVIMRKVSYSGKKFPASVFYDNVRNLLKMNLI
ncbi:MAG: amidohydrolase family protein [Deltaproteobacteria bacterium]|nr:amidohydrolase family protein [Deltaproteobacteria bacterium]